MDVPAYLVWAQQPNRPWPTKHVVAGTMEVMRTRLYITLLYIKSTVASDCCSGLLNPSAGNPTLQVTFSPAAVSIPPPTAAELEGSTSVSLTMPAFPVPADKVSVWTELL